MRLTELDPRWWEDAVDRYGQGISFVCPHCTVWRIIVHFSNPIDGSSPSKLAKTVLYRRRGATFKDLTITPRVYAPDHARVLIVDGEVAWEATG